MNKPEPPVQWELRLYTAGQSPKSVAAYTNLKLICDTYLPGQYHIEVIDLLVHRARLALAFVLVGAVGEELACRRIERQHDIGAGAISGLLDPVPLIARS